MLASVPTLTIDDAVIMLVASDEGEDWAGQELSHSQLMVLIERVGWRPTDSEKFTNMPKGLVSKWLLERRIPMHPRTRRIKFDDLVLAAGTPGRLQPTSPRTLERRALAEQERINHRVIGLRTARDRAERQIMAHDRSRDSLVNTLERIDAELEAAKAEEQRLYDAGDRINTFTRLDPTVGWTPPI